MTQKGLLNNHVLPLFGEFKLDKLTTPLIQSTMNKLANSTNTGEAGAYLHYGKIHTLNKRILQYGVDHTSYSHLTQLITLFSLETLQKA